MIQDFNIGGALFIAALVVGIFAARGLLHTHRRKKRLAFIESYSWPSGLINRLHHHYPHLRATDDTKISNGLKQFFRAYLNGGLQPVAMPSQAADDLWHEFIIYTKAYQQFCDRAFGRFLHHTPAVALKNGAKSDNEGLRRVWWHACKEEGIEPRSPAKLPLLFRLDAELDIPNGYRYSPDCKALRERGVSGTQCGGDFSSSSFDGGTSGLGDGDGGSGAGGDSDGGSDGGGGGCGGD